jgi:tetratricopeptide (TPR) repeat protein
LVRGDLKGAFDNFSKAVEIDQDNSQAWFLLGTVSLEQGQAENSESFFIKAMHLDRSNIDYALSLGKAYTIGAKYDSAERLYADISSRFSSDWQIKAAAGSLSMTLGRFEKAAKYYKQAAILSKDDPAVLESLGYCYIADGKWADAADIFAKLSDIADNEQYSEILTVCQMNSGKYDKAKSRFDSVSDTQRDNPDFWLSLGQAHLGLNSANAAIACAKRALILRPNWAEATALLASGEYINKDYQSALLNFNKIKDNADIGAFAYLMIGRCYDRLGQSSKAKLAYQTSLSINPNNSYAADLAEKF